MGGCLQPAPISTLPTPPRLSLSSSPGLAAPPHSLLRRPPAASFGQENPICRAALLQPGSRPSSPFILAGAHAPSPAVTSRCRIQHHAAGAAASSRTGREPRPFPPWLHSAPRILTAPVQAEFRAAESRSGRVLRRRILTGVLEIEDGSRDQIEDGRRPRRCRGRDCQPTGGGGGIPNPGGRSGIPGS